MVNDPRLTLDMTPDGRFRQPPRAPGIPLSTRIVAIAVLVGVAAIGFSVAAFALWVLAMLVPVVLVAGAVVYATVRFKIWQARRRGGAARGVMHR